MELLFNTLHIVSAVFIVGPMAILPMTAMRSMRAGEAGQVAALAKSVYLFSLLSVLVAFFGFGALGMADADEGFSFGSTWVWLSIVLYVIALAINLFLVVPAMRSAAEALSTEALSTNAMPATGTKIAGYSRVAMGSGIASLLLVLIVVLMVWKP
ncbi:DUF2269 family protein [Cryobacterium sp. TMT1-21]|uniref:DUF2269 family protein n=1 Tax=Cryobacterium shii TaxID=1259235 RepID=A0AAQ2C6N3_9MICO|nr:MULTISPECIES: DUF2269 family protein [Cryobacterium]TFC48877.1 DUF2269 family protein [Cryobacterium shii]TFC82966.1 DUF2269 family protein [Cryobacterium sp. TmT2-59]TFD12565.1 DUF2269 family protein [Cryobacterium sp. TMT1-21]TFD17252.1 DUF2269 family protein [Cryobacterium sp. TMT4-10]TFD25729.1 DUF2269 family protein [Cryobacterium sp. TMT2-23]